MPFPILGAVALGSSLIGSLFKGSRARKQQRMADAIKPVNAVYKTSPFAQNQLATVQQMMGGRMAGAASAEQGVQNNFANAMAGVDRNSTNSAQSLSMLAGLNSNANQAVSDLQTKEEMNRQNMLGQLAYANQAMTAEGDKVYNDQLRNYNNDVAAKNALQNAAWQNTGGAVSDVQNSLIMAGNIGAQGGFSNIFGNRSAGNTNMPQLITGGSGIANTPMGYAAPATGGYINPHRNFVNPFIKTS